MITRHAAERALERAGITDPYELYWLWKRGREACADDLVRFNTIGLDDVIYRIIVRRHRAWLLARGATTGAFITIIPRNDQGPVDAGPQTKRKIQCKPRKVYRKLAAKARQ